jgi:opacity protein-like surface antigen
MKNLMILGAASAALLGSSALAQDVNRGIYIGANLGVASVSDIEETYDHQFSGPDFNENVAGTYQIELTTGAVFKLLAGYRLNDRFGIELERSARAAVIEDSYDDSVVATGFTGVNAVFFMAGEQRITPYVGAGLGYATLESDDIDLDDYDGAMAWQVKGGFLLPVGAYHGFTLEAAYQGYAPFEGSNSFSDGIINEEYSWELETSTFDVSVGYRFQFGG